jgi:SAM-dependent methyltransferase
VSPGARGEATAPQADEATVWHDVECAGYTADLALWHELAAAAGEPVLELGAGTGRVALDLAARGHELTALDTEPALLSALRRRARERGLRVRTAAGDARAFTLRARFALVIAPMQVAQLLGGERGRRAMLRCVRRHLSPGGALALALADPLEGMPAEDALPPLPDVRELDGWVYSSRPVAVRESQDGTVIERVREAVSPAGDLRQSASAVVLDRVDGDEFAKLGEESGFRRLPGRSVPATESYVGSDVVVLEAA